MSAAHSGLLSDRQGRTVLRGRTADISENGVFFVARRPRRDLLDRELILRMELPSGAEGRTRQKATRTVQYLCRVTHVRPLGPMAGLGLAFIRKLP